MDTKTRIFESQRKVLLNIFFRIGLGKIFQQ